MYIQLVIVYFLIITYKSLISAFPINETNQCITKSGGPGECIKAGKCDTLIKNKLKIIMFNKCNKPGLICCPTITKTINNSGSNKIIPAIINGDSVEPNEYPFMVALGKMNYETIVWNCGGSIISSKFILTAAHCLGITNIAVGTNNLIDIKPEQTINESEFDFIPHENSNPNEKARPNDIAIIKLKKDLVFNEAVNSITLAPKSMVTLPDVAKVLGFGSTQMYGSTSSKILAQAELHQSPCPFYFVNITNQICYLGSNDNIRLRQGACGGDSGGPLFVKENDGEYVQIGIVSYSYLGCVKAPNVFTSIPIFRDWIDSQQLDTL